MPRTLGIGPIGVAAPLDRSHPLNRGLASWIYPWALRGFPATVLDLAGTPGTFANGAGYSPAVAFADSRALELPNSGVPHVRQAYVPSLPFSVSFWVRKRSATANQVAFSVGYSLVDWDGYYFVLNTDGTVGASTVYGAFATAYGAGGSGVDVGHWHHLAGVWASDSLRKCYVDGVLTGTDTHTLSPGYASNQSFWSRESVASPSLPVDGQMASLAVWGRALSDAEVAAVYEEDRRGNPFRLKRLRKRTVVLSAGVFFRPSWVRSSASPGTGIY